ncbi:MULTISPECIES: ArsR/SmtB family transcription factor [Nocardioides]|uniref:SRPBCC domain-containing protein n=1 Tax=Nocardioides vastitatis TaxID=2568655 RepID=A0ABW0ZKA8_9ACTN|nr:SRPBCC domain-containing protein [Nocardioides sp.]THI96652.1 ArsR family transcriptional regulator [Nocardioides sp.]
MTPQQDALDRVFKALADPSRRLLLDRLRQENGQTLTQLCSTLEMARQSATQHLDLLAQADLVVVVRRGRERLHYLNPAPIHEIGERWIAAYDAPRLAALSTIRDRAEETAMTETATTVPTYVYVTYIRASAEQVWKALTDADLTAQYWHHANVSDWQVGSPWEHRRVDGSGVDVVGTVLEAEPPTRLSVTFEDSPHEERANGPSVVTFLIEPHADVVRLTVTHENLPNMEMHNGISSGWPAVLANLKSLLETGEVLPSGLWEMPSAT